MDAASPTSLMTYVSDRAGAIDRALIRVGLAPDTRAFRPHVTLARLSRGAGPIDPWLAEMAGLQIATATIGHFHLYESHLGADGARYEPIERYALDERR